ncbi:MAG: hypothetical protein ACRD3V_18430 [Vicinamibacteria bacterium]
MAPILSRQIVEIVALLAGIAATATPQHGDDAQLLSRLSSSRHTLIDGIRQAEESDGLAISAKFEMKGDRLLLSVYTAKQGRDADAEHNTLMELIGPATDATWKPETEVFADREHLARSAMQLTLMQVIRMSLAEAVEKAESQQPGTVYSAIPSVQAGRPVVDVLVATREGHSKHVMVDLK